MYFVYTSRHKEEDIYNWYNMVTRYHIIIRYNMVKWYKDIYLYNIPVDFAIYNRKKQEEKRF